MTEKENDGALLEGHPSGGAMEQPKAEGGSTKIRFGSHEFSSVEELTTAYAKLESELGRKGNEIGELRAMSPERLKPETRPRRTLDFKKLGDTIIENPEQAVKEITGYVEEVAEEKVASWRNRAAEESEKASREDRVWNRFFELNPWLDHRREEVKVVAYNVLWPELEGKKMDDQFKKISEHFRESTERSSVVLEGKELPQRRPISASSPSPSGVTIPTKPQDEGVEKRKSFADSVRSQSYVPKVDF